MIKILNTIVIIFLLIKAVNLNAQSYYTKTNTETNLSSFTTINGQWNASNPANNTLGVIHYQGLNFGFDTNNYATIVSGVESSNLYFGRWSGNWKGWRKIVMENESGNLGIGTDNASNKLEVVGTHPTTLEVAGFYNTRIYGDVNDKSETRINIGKIEGTIRQPMGAIGAFPENNISSGDGNLAFYTRQNQAVIERIRISSIGNVGIGIKNPDSKLAVNGTIHSKEVKVDMEGWSDFVFKKEYDLPKLEEVEKHINEKGHLENIPTEEEVLKNGINLGEMNAKLLQKIEELTLYVIEQNKKIEKQNNEVEIIKKENETINLLLKDLLKLNKN